MEINYVPPTWTVFVLTVFCFDTRFHLLTFKGAELYFRQPSKAWEHIHSPFLSHHLHFHLLTSSSEPPISSRDFLLRPKRRRAHLVWICLFSHLQGWAPALSTSKHKKKLRGVWRTECWVSAMPWLYSNPGRFIHQLQECSITSHSQTGAASSFTLFLSAYWSWMILYSWKTQCYFLF